MYIYYINIVNDFSILHVCIIINFLMIISHGFCLHHSTLSNVFSIIFSGNYSRAYCFEMWKNTKSFGVMFESNSKYGTNIVGCKGLQYFKPLNFIYIRLWCVIQRFSNFVFIFPWFCSFYVLSSCLLLLCNIPWSFMRISCSCQLVPIVSSMLFFNAFMVAQNLCPCFQIKSNLSNQIFWWVQ